MQCKLDLIKIYRDLALYHCWVTLGDLFLSLVKSRIFEILHKPHDLIFAGDFEIQHIDKVSMRLYQKYGKIVKMEGLLGRPDMLFLFDPDEIESVFRREDWMPLRPSMPSLNYYKHKLRKEFFGDYAGVIAV